MSDRAALREKIVVAVKHAFARPKYQVAERLADKLMPTIRQAQADAWMRGWAAGMLDHTHPDTTMEHRNPYIGGRHSAVHVQTMFIPVDWHKR